MTSDEKTIAFLKDQLLEKQVLIDELKKLLIHQNPWLNQPVFNNQKEGVGEKEPFSIWELEMNKKNNQLFNAFILSRSEEFKINAPFDYECMRSITESFYKYLQELDEMGRHELYAG